MLGRARRDDRQGNTTIRQRAARRAARGARGADHGADSRNHHPDYDREKLQELWPSFAGAASAVLRGRRRDRCRGEGRKDRVDYANACDPRCCRECKCGPGVGVACAGLPTAQGHPTKNDDHKTGVGSVARRSSRAGPPDRYQNAGRVRLRHRGRQDPGKAQYATASTARTANTVIWSPRASRSTDQEVVPRRDPETQPPWPRC